MNVRPTVSFYFWITKHLMKSKAWPITLMKMIILQGVLKCIENVTVLRQSVNVADSHESENKV